MSRRIAPKFFIFVFGIIVFYTQKIEIDNTVFPNAYNTIDVESVDTAYLKNMYIPFRECFSSSCLVFDDTGGPVRAYYESAKIIEATFNTVAISGECASACAGWADIISNHVCLLPPVEFLYHTSNTDRIPNYFSQWTIEWVVQHGGFPKYSSHKLLSMPYSVARQHWRTCEYWDIYKKPKNVPVLERPVIPIYDRKW